MGLKKKQIFEKQKTKDIRSDIRCKKVDLWSGGGALKKGIVKTAHIRYPYTSDIGVPVPTPRNSNNQLCEPVLCVKG